MEKPSLLLQPHAVDIPSLTNSIRGNEPYIPPLTIPARSHDPTLTTTLISPTATPIHKNNQASSLTKFVTTQNTSQDNSQDKFEHKDNNAALAIQEMSSQLQKQLKELNRKVDNNKFEANSLFYKKVNQHQRNDPRGVYATPMRLSTSRLILGGREERNERA